MLKLIFKALVIAGLLTGFSPALMAAGENEAVKVREATEVLNEIMAIPEKSMPPSLLTHAHAIAIVPNVVKVGFVIGGRYGQGVVLRHNGKGGWGAPVFMTLTGGSVGWQIGAQSSDIILVFKNQRGLDSLVNGKFTLGADAAVAAGPVGRNAAAATDAQLKSEIYSYSRSRGLFAGIALDGSVLEIDHSAGANYYGKPGIRAADIFAGKVPRTPASAKALDEALNKYAGH